MFLFFNCDCLTLFLLSPLFFAAVRRPSLSKFHRDHVHKARLDRNFHSLVNLQRLAKWGLGPNPSIEALAHELTVRRREFPFVYLKFLSVI